MFTRWTKGLNEQQIKDLKSNIVAAQPAMKALMKLIEEDLRVTEKQTEDKAEYLKSSWPYLQADLIGEKRAYRKVIKLIRNLYNEEK